MDGRQEGEEIVRYPDGRVESKRFYKGGRGVGVWYIDMGDYYINETHDDNGKRIKHEEYYASGQRKKLVLKYGDGTSDGYSWWPTGQVESTWHDITVKGVPVLDGPLREHNQQGQVVKETVYNQGEIVRQTTWGPNGQTLNELSESTPTGPYTELWDDGTNKVTGMYKDGYREGQWTDYYRNGSPETIAFYKAAKKVGEWSYYTETGILTRTEKYDNDKLVSTTTYHPNGKPAQIVTKLPHGKKIVDKFYPSGNIKESTLLIFGETLSTDYYEDEPRLPGLGKVHNKITFPKSD